MATNVTLQAGKTWVTGESVTAAKLNTSQTGAQTLVNDIDTGSSVSSGGSDIFKQKATNDLEFKGIVGGTNITLSESATDITINNDLTAASGSNYIDVGSKRQAWFTGTSATTETSQVISFGGIFSSVDTVLVSTDYPNCNSSSNSWFQLCSFTSASATVFSQSDGSLGAGTPITPRILVIGVPV